MVQKKISVYFKKLEEMTESEPEPESVSIDPRLEQVISSDDIHKGMKPAYDAALMLKAEDGGESLQMVLKSTHVMIEKSVRCTAWRRALLNTYTRKYEALLENGEYDDLCPTLRTLRDKVDEYSKKISDWLMLTVNPRDGVSLPDFVKRVEKAVSKKWILQAHWVFEQRSDTSDYKGMHAHILFRHDGKRLSQIRREFASTFHSVCDVSNPSIMNLRLCPGEDDFKRMVSYLRGEKDFKGDKSYKEGPVRMTFEWRQENGLQDFYSKHEVGVAGPSYLLGPAS